MKVAGIRAVLSRRNIGYLAIPIFGLASPLIALPALTASFGASGWASVAVGQSVGSAGAVLVELGWALNGPQRVAAMSQAAAARFFSVVLSTKLMAFAVLGPASAAAGALLVPSAPLVGALTAFGTSLVGLAPGWFFIGRGRPALVMVCDSGLRLACMVAVAALLMTGAALEWYALIGLVLPGLVCPLVGLYVAGGGKRPKVARPSRLTALAIRGQVSALSGRTVSALYIGLPTSLVSIVAPGSVEIFATAERLMRMGLTALTAVPNAMQSWVGQGHGRIQKVARAERTVLPSITLGVAAGSFYFLAAPKASEFIFSGSVALPTGVLALGAGVVFLTCSSRAVGGVVLVAFGRIRSVMRSAFVAAALGVPGVVAGALHFGPAGAMAGLVIAEAGALLYQLGAWKVRQKAVASRI